MLALFYLTQKLFELEPKVLFSNVYIMSLHTHNSILWVGLLIMHLSDFLFSGGVYLTQHTKPVAKEHKKKSKQSMVKMCGQLFYKQQFLQKQSCIL